MAIVSITIPDALIPRVKAAGRAMFPQFEALTDAQAFKAITALHWQTILSDYEKQKSIQAINDSVNADAITIS